MRYDSSFTGLPRSGESQGKRTLFKVREKSGNFLKIQENSLIFFKVSEMSVNLLVKANALHEKSSQKRQEVENEKNQWPAKKS